MSTILLGCRWLRGSLPVCLELGAPMIDTNEDQRSPWDMGPRHEAEEYGSRPGLGKDTRTIATSTSGSRCDGLSHGASVFDGFFFMTDEDGNRFFLHAHVFSPPDVHIYFFQRV